jgi:hypothetical protein
MVAINAPRIQYNKCNSNRCCDNRRMEVYDIARPQPKTWEHKYLMTEVY